MDIGNWLTAGGGAELGGAGAGAAADRREGLVEVLEVTLLHRIGGGQRPQLGSPPIDEGRQIEPLDAVGGGAHGGAERGPARGAGEATGSTSPGPAPSSLQPPVTSAKKTRYPR